MNQLLMVPNGLAEVSAVIFLTDLTQTDTFTETLPSEKARPKARPIKKKPTEAGIEPSLNPNKQTSEVLERNKPLLTHGITTNVFIWSRK